MLFLDALYRDGAGKAGITYVDVWDGFVDEAGRFLQKGPDFEGQIRQLRSYDGVFFTKPGARKLAHYVEREVIRLLAARSGPIALPSEPATPDANAAPGQPAPRPLAGPILPLVASSVGTDQLLGGPARVRPRSMRSPRARWSRAKRWRRPPAAPTILPGRAARSAANRPRAKRRWPTLRPSGTVRGARAAAAAAAAAADVTATTTEGSSSRRRCRSAAANDAAIAARFLRRLRRGAAPRQPPPPPDRRGPADTGRAAPAGQRRPIGRGPAG